MLFKSLIKTIKTHTITKPYLYVGFVVAAFSFMVVLSSYFMSKIVRNQLISSAQAELALLEKVIMADLKEPRTVLGNQSEIVRNMILRGNGEGEVRDYMVGITKYIMDNEKDQLSGFAGIFGCFDVFGGVFIDGQNRRMPEDFVVSERPWYKKAVAAGGEISFLPPYVGFFLTESVITYSRAIFDNNGNLLGVIALDINFARIKEYISNANINKLWFGILLDEQYRFIFHRDPKLEGTKFENVSGGTAKLVAELKSGVNEVNAFRMVNYQNVESIAFVKKLENGWYLGIITPENVYFMELRNMSFTLIILGAVLTVIFSVVVVTVVIQKHKADEKIIEADKAIVANHYKNDFLAKVSHEIRTPMNVILGITEMQLEKNGFSEETKEAWDKVYSSGYLLLNIINDILDLSKIEAGKLELVPVNYDVASVINDTVQLNMMRFDSKPIELKLLVDENIPSTLFGDDLRIKQILNNILSNAYKYTDKGEISISVSADVKGAEEPVVLILRISDTGHGMTGEQVSKLFNDYSRFDLKANRSIEGTGLGMSITKQMVELMNGEIIIESEPGKGTVFTVRLPQGYVGNGVLGKEGAENLRKLHKSKTVQPKKAPNIVREYMPYGKVLVVDDMEPNLYVARGLLAPYGLSVETATSGYSAIDLIKSGMTFDVIFMDHFMPEIDGFETTKTLRNMGYANPIVALTANALVGQAEMFLENGFNGFLSKPIDIRQLNITLNKLVRDKYPAQTIEAAQRLKSKLEQETVITKLDLSHKKALVVDDFLPNLKLAAGMLQKYKIQVDCVSSGKEAIDRIKSGEPKYDIIFMDHLMPDMDGIETTLLIRSLNTEYTKNISIIALTTIAPDEVAEKEQMFLDNGFQAILSKPISIAKLDVFFKSWMHDKIKDDTVDQNNRENNMVIEIPGVDTKKVMELYDGDMETYLTVIRSYVSVIPESLDIMSRVSAETLPEYIVKVHGVKSTSESIGAEEARKMAFDLEALAKAGDLSGVLAKNGALIQYVKELLVNIQNWLARLDKK